MSETPSILVLSSSETPPDDIIKLILDVSELPEKIYIDEDIHAFPWTIDNKYYTADVHICSLHKKSIGNRDFAETVEAIILHFESSSSDILKTIQSWLPFINEYTPDIKILLCESISDGNKRSVQEWCVGKGFELVELEPIDEAEEDDDFPETTGIKRIIQALNAHVWPNLTMKSDGKANMKYKEELNNVKQHFSLEESLEELLDNDDNFSALFSQLPEMKAKIASLSGADRKSAAEQVVQAFWKALGEDEDEFLDL